MTNEKLNNFDNMIEELHSQLKECIKKLEKDFFVIGVGGKESWLTAIAANEILGRNKVLIVNTYSIFSSSVMPFKVHAACQENNFQFCDIDITEAVQKTLSVPIGLFRIEKEQLHYMMSPLQKNEIAAMVRNTILRGISDRHNGMLLSGISLSKIANNWLSPSLSMFDWNPLVNCTHKQVQSTIEKYNMGMELNSIPSGLDLDTRGGPFPSDYDIDLTNDELTVKENKIKNLGKGIFQ